MLYAWKKYVFQPLFLFLIILVLKISLVRSEILDASFGHSLYIELPVLFMILTLIEWISQNKPRLRLTIYMTVNGLLSLILFALIIYFQYFNSIATYTSLFSLNQTGDVRASILSLIEWRHLLLFADFPVLLISMLSRKFIVMLQRSTAKASKTTTTASTTTAKASTTATTAAKTSVKPSPFKTTTLPMRNRYGVLVMMIALILSLTNALHAVGGGTANELVKAKNMGIITYQAYAVYSDAKQALRENEEVSPHAVRKLKGITLADQPMWNGIANGDDVYVIQLESLQNFVVGMKIGGQEITPNLNQLMGESIYFDRFFQQIGKGNTSDAEFVMNTSLYPTGVLPMSQQTAGLEVPSLPRFLDPYGYESVTLHTNEAKFWDRDSMYPALGFDRYYDKEFFGEEDVLHFGASDEVLFRKSIEVFRDIKERGNRIYANLITMSNHNPFDLPEDKQMLELPKHLDGTYIGDFLQSVHYADYALGIFIDELKSSGLWDDAMLVIYGDHFGISVNSSEKDLKLAADIIGVPSYNQAEMFKVPLVIRIPGIEEGMVRHNMGGQVDILPTVMNLLGVPYDDKVIFGQDLLNHEHNLIGQRVYLPGGSFINEEVIFIPGEGIEDGYAVPLHPDRETKPINQYENDYYLALRLLEMSDAYVSSLPPQEAIPVTADQAEEPLP